MQIIKNKQQQQQTQQNQRKASNNQAKASSNGYQSAKDSNQGSQTLQKFKENQSEVQDQLNQLMHKYTSIPQKSMKSESNAPSTGHNSDKNSFQNINTNSNNNHLNHHITQQQTIGNQAKHVKNNKSQRAQHFSQIEKPNDLHLRMSCFGIPQETEAEDYDNLEQFANDYFYEENDIPLPLTFHNQAQQQILSNQKQGSGLSNYKSNDVNSYIQPQLSKSPNPILVNSNMISTPTSIIDVKSSQPNPMQILNQFNLQQNHRNPTQPLSLGYLSHHIQNFDTQPLLRDKKKSISTATSNSTNGTFTNLTGSNQNHKRQSGFNGMSEKVQNQKGDTNSQQNSSKEPHKKSQSLYNKKIVDIITGLQQSLGVIANNVQNSFNHEDIQSKQQQQKTLLESALLAQKLAQMTQGFRKESAHDKKSQEVNGLTNNIGTFNMKTGKISDANNTKRKSMKIQSNLSGRGSLNVVQKHKAGFKTLEDAQQDGKKQSNNSNRMSIDFQQPMRKMQSKVVHQRNRSDLQNPRKNLVQAVILSANQIVASGNHTKQNTLLTCSNSSIEGNPLNSQHHINQIVQDDLILTQQTANHGLPSSAKSLNRINQAINKQAIIQSCSNATKSSKKSEICGSIDNTTMSDAIFAKYKSAMTGPQSSGQQSMVANTMEIPRQSLGQLPQFHRSNTNQFSSNERLSEANNQHKTTKLVISNGDSLDNYEVKLKSAASSPTLHGSQNQIPISTNQIKRKYHQQSQSNTVFDFGINQNKINQMGQGSGLVIPASTIIQPDKVKPVNNTKKKNLIVGGGSKKDNAANSKSEQNTNSNSNNNTGTNHKRSTSDGSSLTKMFHFKQQMLINKIFQQQNSKENIIPSTAVAAVQNTQHQKTKGSDVNGTQSKKQRASMSKNHHPQDQQQQQKGAKKSKVQVISSLSSKRLSNEENQENMINNINLHSPRTQQQQLKNLGKMIPTKLITNAPEFDVKISQDMKAFLQKFKDKTNVVNPLGLSSGAVQYDSQQQKQLLIQAITQQQNQALLKQSLDDVSYMTQKTSNKQSDQNYGLSKQNTNTQKLQDSTSYHQNENTQNKRQSMQQQQQLSSKNSNKMGQSHKRAKSDAQKQFYSQQNQQQRAQNIIIQANQASSNHPQGKQQKMFFLNLNQQQQQLCKEDYGQVMTSQQMQQQQQQQHQQLQQLQGQNTKNNYENYQLIYGNSQQNNFIYSARASPSSKINYYNFDESQRNIGSTITKPFLPTARSETSAKQTKNAMSNQTTQKKNTYHQNANNNFIANQQLQQTANANHNRLIESVNTKLVYNDQNLDQLFLGGGNKYLGGSAVNILQSQQFNKLASILYGDGNNANNNLITYSNPNKNNHANNNNEVLYSTLDDNESLIFNSNHLNMNFNNNSNSNNMFGQADLSLQIINKKLIGSDKSLRNLEMQSHNQSPKMKVMPTPKLVQPGGVQISNFNQYEDIQFQNQQVSTIQSQQQAYSTYQHQTYEMNQLNAKQNNLDRMIQNQAALASNYNTNPNPNKCEFDGNQFQTFESNLTTHTMNNMTPRARDKHRLVKQIKLSFNKLKEPIKTSSDFYRIGKMLGKGAFGRVNLAIHKLCNHLVAVKSINKQFLSEDENSKKKMMQEVLILQKTRHDNLVRLYDSFETNKHIVFVMELCAGGDLLNYVRKRRKLKENIAKYVFKQVVDGLHYCHSKGIVHRDMKLDNLLFDEQGVVKICDFGVSKLLSSSQEIMTEQCGTPAYIAPEILKDKGYKGFGVDIWSLGVCLYAMLFGTVPFKANNMSELHQLILKAKYSMKEELKPGELPLSEDVKSLLKSLLEPSPDKRITIEGIQQHQWLLEISDQQDIEIFTQQELETIRKDFTYQDMSRYQRNKLLKMKIEKQNQENGGANGCGAGGIVTTEENLFTEHALDSTQNVLMRNCTTKSVILAPFNSTRTHLVREDLEGEELEENLDDSRANIPPLEIDQAMMADKRVIKYAPRVKDINRQYEMNNNCELDNGVYNKFVKQSTNGEDKSENDQDKSENSLVTSMNGEGDLLGGRQNEYVAPLVSQNSDEEVEAELIKRNQAQCKSELQQMQTFLQKQKTEFKQVPDEPILIDYEVVERVEVFGYPRQFIIDSIEKYDMNDAATNYYLLDKEKQQIEDFQGYLQ
ncbi:protein kinase domain containing protein [Stylonychia lemnae]|uniref:Protein kinase domain containing protein n=1 Tax=Stylonychia lemnae TaxID=5949 RepID=A0A077ZSC6_STYLE|nr:protein kinase domain containing protein [Stylonychia lemnae]|eukprot:CDW72434.1 protein kinase domain containing protein [Stylonychia lemnae]